MVNDTPLIGEIASAFFREWCDNIFKFWHSREEI